MDFRNFLPLTTISPRSRRADYVLDDYALHCLLATGPFPFSDLSLNDMTRSPQQSYPRVTAGQGFVGPTFRVRGVPTDPSGPRAFDSVPLRPRFRNGDYNFYSTFGGFGPRYLNSEQNERAGRPRVRFIEVVDENPDQPTRIDVETRRRGPNPQNEETLSPWDFSDHDPYAERDRASRRRVTITPSSPRYQLSDGRDQQFQAIESRSKANLSRNANPNPALEVGLPFGKALRWLHEALVDVEKFFRTFQEAYNREIKGVDEYAGVEILRDLWVKKVSGKGAPQSEGGHDQKLGEGGKWEEKFTEKRRSLREAMEAALNASLSLGEQETPEARTVESRRRLQEKVLTSGQHVIDLLGMVGKESECCKALLGELKLLRDLVNPKKMENKLLFDGIESEDGAGFQDDGGGGYDQPSFWDNNDNQ